MSSKIKMNVNNFKRFENKKTVGFFTLEMVVENDDKVSKFGVNNCVAYKGKNDIQWSFHSTQGKDGEYYNDGYVTKDLYNYVVEKVRKEYEESKSSNPFEKE